jgi:hypothetical protein
LFYFLLVLCEIVTGLGIPMEGFGSIRRGTAIDRAAVDSGAGMVLRQKSDTDNMSLPSAWQSGCWSEGANAREIVRAMTGVTPPTWFRPGSSRRYSGHVFFSTAVLEEVAFLWKEEQRSSEKKKRKQIRVMFCSDFFFAGNVLF